MTHISTPHVLRSICGLLAVGLLTVACTSANAKTSDTAADCGQFEAQKTIAQAMEVAVGDEITVTLCSNPTTGFSWQEPEISDRAAVGLVEKTFIAPANSGAPVVGAAGSDRITLKATAKGTSTVALRYSQPWVGGTASAWTYRLTVTVV